MSKVILKNVRLGAFADLFEAVEYTKGDGKPRYNANYLIEKGSENDKNIRAALTEVAKEEFGEKPVGPKNTPAYLAKMKAMSSDSGKFCYHDGDLKEREEYEGHMLLAGHRALKQGAPAIRGRGIDPTTGKLRVLVAADGKPYPGCYVNATVDLYVQGTPWPGFRCTIIGLQYVSDGDAFSGSQATDDDFDDMGDDEEDGLDGEDPMDEFGSDDTDDTDDTLF